MRWSKFTLDVSDTALQKRFNSEFTDIYSQHNHPDGMTLYQADPHNFVDLYISYKKSDSWMVTNFKKKFNGTDVNPPDTEKLFLIIGEKRSIHRNIPLIQY